MFSNSSSIDSVGIFFNRLLLLFRSTQFILLTLIGNTFIVMISFIFYYIENGANPLVTTWLDAIWWAFATVTTVGYGDIVPITAMGRILGIGLMMVGTGLFATYTALFANALLGREFLRLDRKMKVIHRNVTGLKEEVNEEEAELLNVIEDLKSHIARLENRINKDK